MEARLGYRRRLQARLDFLALAAKREPSQHNVRQHCRAHLQQRFLGTESARPGKRRTLQFIGVEMLERVAVGHHIRQGGEVESSYVHVETFESSCLGLHAFLSIILGIMDLGYLKK